jgi:putative transposase
LEIAFSLDCHDREVIRWIASNNGIDGQTVRDLMAETMESRFPNVTVLPYNVQWLSDNGPGYTADETVRFGRAIGLDVCTTAPYSPESNGMAEAFVKTFKRDYVAFGDLSSAAKLLEQLPKWFEDYNELAPHKGLAMKSPREYLRQYQHA